MLENGNHKVASSLEASSRESVKEKATSASSFSSHELPAYKLELKLRKNYAHFLKFLEEEIKKEPLAHFKIKKTEHKVSFFYTTKGRVFLRPKFEVKIKVKKADKKNFHLSLTGKPLSYTSSRPDRYINKLLLRILSSRV